MAWIDNDDVINYDDSLDASDIPEIDLRIEEVQSHVETLEITLVKPAATETKKLDYFQCVRRMGMKLQLPDYLGEITTVTNGDGLVVVENTDFIGTPHGSSFDTLWMLFSTGKRWTYETDPQQAIEIEGYWYYTETLPERMRIAMVRHVVWLIRTKGKGDQDKLPKFVEETYKHYEMQSMLKVYDIF